MGVFVGISTNQPSFRDPLDEKDRQTLRRVQSVLDMVAEMLSGGGIERTPEEET